MNEEEIAALQAENRALRHALVDLASTVRMLVIAQTIAPGESRTTLEERLIASAARAEALLGRPRPKFPD